MKYPAAVSQSEAHAAAKKLLSSAAFSNSPRLSQFLEYILEEKLEGREERVSGTTITIDVFGRDPTKDPNAEVLVRVHAGNLRRKLEHYNSTTGCDDPVHITLPKGSYVPTFEWNRPSAMTPMSFNRFGLAAKSGRRLSCLPISSAISLLALVSWVSWFLIFGDTGEHATGERPIRNAEATALFLESRQISRPPSNKTRVLAGLELARQIYKIDPDFSGGYAAESFLLWSLIVFGHSASPEADKARSLELAKRAVKLDPSFGWSYLSLSRALHLLGELDGSVAAAKNAVRLSPETAEFQGNLGLVLTFAGRPGEAIKPLKSAIKLTSENPRNPYRNYLGIAYFHAGKFRDSIQLIETSRRLGGPIGPHMYAYLAAANAKISNIERAQAAAEKLLARSSVFRVREFIQNLFRHNPRSLQQIIEGIESAGIV
jgi:hypothetical protein